MLQLSLPITPFYTEELPSPDSYPINQPDWFEERVEQDFHHHYVHLVTEIWPYTFALPIPFPGADNCVGQLSFTAAIKQVPKSLSEDARNLTVLGKLEAQLRDSHYWAPPEKDKGWRGYNSELKQKAIKRFPRYQYDFPSLEAFIDERIAVHGYPSVIPEIKEVCGRQFAFYLEGQGRDKTDRIYCLPLNQEYYLMFRFSHRLQTAKEKVKKAALAAERRILSEMSLGSVMLEQPVLISDPIT